ncbi:transketolase [Desulfomonile tiedjei]|uniref:Transketolase, beta subunit n=1 Tax=Desulfomonile tiedjei (strain ATCC 49306 / DSM 6799 / DCB-1) TaxID=706587 RepID=I4C004_DESTA|nr:transketolase [Desulfomonile tiedjei]AFM22895.1 transketolase, beta subunit [Desulfomonile tiedjei DSM 6799]
MNQPAAHIVAEGGLVSTAKQIRKIIIEESKRANVGHIGSALSIADIIAVLFGNELRLIGTDDPLRDRFILSKGHAALALYAALHLEGVLTEGQIQTYCKDGSMLGVHPEHRLRGIDFSTGSLGHGLSIGAGTALAARMKRFDYRTFVLVSDAECNEGALWETVMFAAHQKLSNLVAIVDDNGQQALGKTKDVLDLQPLAEKWDAFGWEVHVTDGHDTTCLREVFASLDTALGKPKVVICKTVCGKGVSFMEGKVAWHYLPLSDEQYLQALGEIEEASFS